VEHPQPDVKVLELLEHKQSALESKRAEKVRVENQRREYEDAYQKALQDFQKQEGVVSLCNRQVVDAERELAEKRNQLNPLEGSLLHFLRLENPQWASDIAKVIRADVLERSDLEPGMMESNNTLFGLSLDLERLDALPAANMSEAEQEVVVAETRFKQAQAELEKARLLLQKISESREAIENNRKKHEISIQKANAQVQSAQAEVDEAKRQVKNSKDQAFILAKELLVNAEQILNKAKQDLVRFDESLQSESKLLREQYHQQKRALKKKRDDEINVIRAEINAQEVQLQTNLSKYDGERDAALREQGVDTAKLKTHHEFISALSLSRLFAENPGRSSQFTLEASGIVYDFSKNCITEETLNLLIDLAKEADLKTQTHATLSTRTRSHVARQRPHTHDKLT
jgi:DNA repair exonuclease SbcCD ATPase subunit